MRDIKFRVWEKNSKTMNYANPYPEDKKGMYLLDNAILFRFHHFDINTDTVKDIVLIQYTGLKDNNGKKIYEGDVVKVGIFTYQVIFSDGCFDVIGIQNDKRDYLKCIVVNHAGIVIGNIYENPDLLEG